MKKALLSLFLPLALCSATACAGVVNFDNLPADENLPVASGYAGFDWTNIHAIASSAYPGSGYEAGTVSPGNAVFNYDGSTASISTADASAFNFVGAYFTSAWFEQELAFDGFRNGQLLYSTAVSHVIDTTTPLWVQLGWSGIDTLAIYNSSGTPWAMDNFTVPEPATMGLFGLSFAGLMLARRRRAAA